MSKTITVSISIDKGVKQDLDRISTDLGLTISKLARNLIYTSLDDYKVMKLFGVSKQIYAFRTSCYSLEPLNSMPEHTEGLDELVQISVVLESDIKASIEKYSSELGIPFKNFSRNLIYIGLKDVKLLRKSGVLAIAKAFEKLVDSYFRSPEDAVDKKK